MGNYYQKEYIVEQLKNFLLGTLAEDSLQDMLKNLSNINDFNDNEKNLYLLILLSQIKYKTSYYTPTAYLLVDILYNKILSTIISEFIIADNNKSSSAQNEVKKDINTKYTLTDISSQISCVADEDQDAFKIFKERYKCIKPGEFKEINLPEAGKEDVITLTDNTTIPGSTYTMKMRIDDSGTVKEFESFYKRKEVKDVDDIYLGLIGDLLNKKDA